MLFQFLAALYERGSLVVTSNLEFSEWTKVFGDDRLTAALLDRLTHRATILPRLYQMPTVLHGGLYFTLTDERLHVIAETRLTGMKWR